MSLKIIGNAPLATDASGKLISRIGIIDVDSNVLITLPGMSHTQQRLYYQDDVNKQRAQQGEPPLTDLEQDKLQAQCVDLIMTGSAIQIRPEPEKMPLAFRADERLQEIVSKRNIRFLMVRNSSVQQAIRERGEYWRISPPPQNEEEIIPALQQARLAIGGVPVYFYNQDTGTRFLTCQTFTDLAILDDATLRRALIEIRDYSAMHNTLYMREVGFFAADTTFTEKAFAGLDFENADPAQLRAWHTELAARFRLAVPSELRCDDPTFIIWRNRLLATLFDDANETLVGPVVNDLPSEFFRMIRWLPGGRIENGELIFDSIFNDRRKFRADKELAELCDERVIAFICNYVREFGGIQHVNIGWVAPSLGHHRPNGHKVYLAEVMCRGASKPVLRILRIQQWGTREHLDRNRDLLYALTQAIEYTEYIHDRCLACWQLGMPLPGRVDTKTVMEVYQGSQQRYQGTRIPTIYFERDFINGLATNRIPESRMKDTAYALSVARLLGYAAAPNMVVGRTLEEGSTEVVFDNGDEMIISDVNHMPQRIVVADHVGTFHECTRPLEDFAAGYAKPVSARAKTVPDPAAFAAAYLTALSERLLQMQEECQLQRCAFATVFQSSKLGEGTCSDRVAKVLDRLERTDIPALINHISEEITWQLTQ
jgi:hypothetical protein